MNQPDKQDQKPVKLIGLSLHCPECEWIGEGQVEHGEDFSESCPECGARLSVLRRSPSQQQEDMRAYTILETFDADMSATIDAITSLPMFCKLGVVGAQIHSHYISRDDELLAGITDQLIPLMYLIRHCN
jgi:hypothetical protein